jgi:hypothetical protein
MAAPEMGAGQTPSRAPDDRADAPGEVVRRARAKVRGTLVLRSKQPLTEASTAVLAAPFGSRGERASSAASALLGEASDAGGALPTSLATCRVTPARVRAGLRGGRAEAHEWPTSRRAICTSRTGRILESTGNCRSVRFLLTGPAQELSMPDLWVLALTFVSFAAAWGFVRLCDAI